MTTLQRKTCFAVPPLLLWLAIGPGAAPASGQSPPASALLASAAADAAHVRLALNEARDGADDPALWERAEALYARRAFQPLWSTSGRRDAAAVFVDAMAQAGNHGLPQALYRVPRWRDFFGGRVQAATRSGQISADVQFTADVLRFATDLAIGSSGESARQIDVPSSLERVEDTYAAEQALRALEPGHAEYRDLRRALERYRRLQSDGGWPTVPSDTRLRLEEGRAETDAASGPSGEPGAYAVCRRLAATGEIPAVTCLTPGLRYGERLAAAVRAFQSRHGLVVDGIVGPNTVAAMNVPIESRIAGLIVNLDRWRQLPDRLGQRHVFVNVAGFRLEARSSGETVLAMRVVAGEPETPTPVFSDEITYLEFRPYWNVPRSITVNELLPRIAQDPGYLRSQGFEVVDGWDEPATVVAPAIVDWHGDLQAFPYRLRQRPGPANSLGLVKFMFPNRYNVYLHDTPATHRFDARRRAFSHGCVRVEQPAALAAFLLDDPGRGSVDAARAAMHGSRREVVPLASSVPVHLTYFTAWVEGADVQFRNDVYGLDAAWLESAGDVRTEVTLAAPQAMSGGVSTRER